MNRTTGRLIGVGIGPGDPELITLKAVRCLHAADVIAYFAKAGHTSNARSISAAHLRPDVEELALLYPVTTEIGARTADYQSRIKEFFDDAAVRIARYLETGRTVAVICEGDPLFYGSYMHVHVRLASRYPTEVIAGVTGMSGCWSSVGAPIAQGDDVFTVLPGTLPEDVLERRIANTDAAVVMKIGRHLPKVRRALDRAGRLAQAIYVERGTTDCAKAMPLVDKRDDHAPYFAIVLVQGWEGRQ
jgi:precorrin-2/cobalt-factor-2 C20-methyltransferase